MRLKACGALPSHMLAFYFVPSSLVALLVTITSSPPLSTSLSLGHQCVTVVVVESTVCLFIYLFIRRHPVPRPADLQLACVFEWKDDAFEGLNFRLYHVNFF